MGWIVTIEDDDREGVSFCPWTATLRRDDYNCTVGVGIGETPRGALLDLLENGDLDPDHAPAFLTDEMKSAATEELR